MSTVASQIPGTTAYETSTQPLVLFWRQTRDLLFLAFGVAFLVEGINRIGFLFVVTPNEGGSSIYVVRLLAFLLILAGMVYKRAWLQKK